MSNQIERPVYEDTSSWAFVGAACSVFLGPVGMIAGAAIAHHCASKHNEREDAEYLTRKVDHRIANAPANYGIHF